MKIQKEVEKPEPKSTYKRKYKPRPRNFPCGECGKFFDSAAKVVIHSVVHTGIKPYKCQYCDKRFG
jgi:hypothetical protein